MNVNTKKYLIDGPVGKIEVALDLPDEVREKGATPRGIALVAHPHPLFGGTLHNKVVFHTMKALNSFGFPVLRFNFRGAGLSHGEHDHGN